jgi:hypothetical protein
MKKFHIRKWDNVWLHMFPFINRPGILFYIIPDSTPMAKTIIQTSEI